MHWRRYLPQVLTTLALILGAPAMGQARPRAPEAVPAPAAPVLPAAREHHQRGIKHYDLGQFAAAIAEFKKAYELSNAPMLLFNIAQAYRLKGDDEHARYFYQRYLYADPNGSGRVDAEKWVATITARSPAPKPATPAVPSAPAAGDSDPQSGSPVAADEGVASGSSHDGQGSRSALRATGVLTLLAGGAFAATAIAFGVKSWQAHDDLVSLGTRRGSWDAHYASLNAEGDRDRTLGISFAAVGGAALIGGTVLCYLGWRVPHEVSIAPRTDGAAMVLRWGF